MDSNDFISFSNEMSEYIVKYLENIRERRVVPEVQHGYLRSLVPECAPEKPENWKEVMADVERVIMPGVTHWQSPRFHAYFPMAQSYPSIVADMLSDAIACVGITWIASPACTELEVITLDWLGKMIDLPAEFLSRSGGKGGGVIQGTASESTLVALLGAKARILKKMKDLYPSMTDTDVMSKLVAYCSKQAHSSVERAGLLGSIKMRLLDCDDERKLRGDTLLKAIESDRTAGLIPFYVVATLGTTSSCAFDALDEIGDVATKEDIWLHIDAAYAGSAFVCPETRYLMKGIEKADSFNFNPHKWMLVNFDCSAMWMKDHSWITQSYNVDPMYLKTNTQSSAPPDCRHWNIPFGRRFRSLKLWFTLRLYGVENIRTFIRHQIELARYFESLCRSDGRFEIVQEVLMGLVCFRMKESNEVNILLYEKLCKRGNIFLVPSKIDDVYFLRMAVCSRFTERKDIEYSWNEITKCADEVWMSSERKK